MAITSIKTGSSFTNLQKYDSFLAGNTAFNPSSYESIASVNAVGGETSVTFSSIPSTYKHLQVRCLSKDSYVSGTAEVTTAIMAINGDNTGANYKYHYLQGDGTAASAAASGTAVTQIWAGSYGATSAYAASIIDIHDYASTTKNKTIRSVAGGELNVVNTNSKSFLFSGLWINTAAITSLRFDALVSGFAAGSTFALYGIKG
jgi:hypothetical protein